MIAGDLRHGAAGEHRSVIGLNVIARDDSIVLLFDQQPLRTLGPRTTRTHVNHREVAPQTAFPAGGS